MGSKYQSQAASGYNSSPPSDDAATTEQNRIKWSTIKTKLTDTLKSYIDAINAQLVTALDVGSAAVISNYNTLAGDNGRVLDASGTVNFNLMDATTAGAGYRAGVKNIGTGIITIGLVTATDKLDQVTNGTVTLTPGQSRTYGVSADGVGYELVAEAGIGAPIGGGLDYFGGTVPGGFLLCDGSTVLRASYPNLFTALSTTWGAGDGSTTFGLPDLRGRTTFGKDNMGGSAANRITNAVSGITGTTLGDTGGSQLLHQHSHSHTHGVKVSATTSVSPTNTINAPADNTKDALIVAAAAASDATAAGTGLSQNIPPAAITNKIIRAL